MTTISLTKDSMKVLRSVSSLSLRKSLISLAKAAMVFTSSSIFLRCERMALAAAASSKTLLPFPGLPDAV